MSLVTIWVWSQFEFLCCHNLSLWFWSKFVFWVVTISIIMFCHNFTYSVLSQFELSYVKICVFEFYHNLSFGVLSQFGFLIGHNFWREKNHYCHYCHNCHNSHLRWRNHGYWPPGDRAIAIFWHYWPLLAIIDHYLPLLATRWSGYSKRSESLTVTTVA